MKIREVKDRLNVAKEKGKQCVEKIETLRFVFGAIVGPNLFIFEQVFGWASAQQAPSIEHKNDCQ